MPIRILVARTSAEKDLVFRLRHQVFVEQEGRFANPSTRLFDRFDCLEETLNLLALDGETPVAAMRVVLDNAVGLPADEMYDFSAVRAGKEGRWCTCGWLCALQSHRAHPGIVSGLFKLAVRKVRQAGNRQMIMTVHPPTLKMFSFFGVRPVGDVFQSEGLGVPVLPCWVDTEAMSIGAREMFEDPANLLLDDSDERRIYTRDEVVFRQGDPPGEAMFVMRGSVRVHRNPGGQDLLFGQGHLLGEIATFDGGPRVATVLAWSREVDVMVWRRETFLRQVSADPERALGVMKLLASRLRRTVGGPFVNPPASLLARVVLDASRRGERAVSPDWLARQCGVWLPDLEGVLADWTSRGWVRRDDEGLLSVVSVDGLAASTTD